MEEYRDITAEIFAEAQAEYEKHLVDIDDCDIDDVEEEDWDEDAWEDEIHEQIGKEEK